MVERLTEMLHDYSPPGEESWPLDAVSSDRTCNENSLLGEVGTCACQTWQACVPSVVRWTISYLVDPASSHMLVSKIKPCMSKYKQIHTVKLRMAH
jgi:hypothetical protein